MSDLLSFGFAKAYCNDVEFGLWPDSQSRNLASNFSSTLCNYDPVHGSPHPDNPCPTHSGLGANVWTEIEQWQVPLGYRPDPGDRGTLIGRKIVDMAHDDDHFELHPIEEQKSTFLQTGPLQRYEPYVAISPDQKYEPNQFSPFTISSDAAFPSIANYTVNGYARLYMAWLGSRLCNSLQLL